MVSPIDFRLIRVCQYDVKSIFRERGNAQFFLRCRFAVDGNLYFAAVSLCIHGDGRRSVRKIHTVSIRDLFDIQHGFT